MAARAFFATFKQQSIVGVYCGVDLRKPVPAFGVQLDKDEEQDGEAPQGGAAVAEEGQGNAYGGHQANGHANIDDPVGEKHAGKAEAIDAAEGVFLFVGQVDDARDQGSKKQHQ